MGNQSCMNNSHFIKYGHKDFYKLLDTKVIIREYFKKMKFKDIKINLINTGKIQ